MTDWGKIVNRITSFIKEKVDEANAKGVVVGISGGIDSASVAFLCVRALGWDRVLGLIMPEKDVTPEEDIEDALKICKMLGIEYKIIEINPAIDAFLKILRHKEDLAIANIKPRVRMIINYYHANSRKMLVAGTGNKSELMVGYFTKYGDGGVDILPIGDLYKTEVFQLAKYLGIPEKIIKKKPSAGLWKGQTDEDELGISYSKLDAILKAIEKGTELTKIPEITGVKEDEVKKVVQMIQNSKHKREMPPVAELRDLISN